MPGQEDSLEKEMATRSSILAWRTPWTEEPGGLQSMGLPRVGHDLAQHSSIHFTEPGSQTSGKVDLLLTLMVKKGVEE